MNIIRWGPDLVCVTGGDISKQIVSKDGGVKKEVGVDKEPRGHRGSELCLRV